MPFTEQEGVLATSSGRRIGWALRGPADGRLVGWLHGAPGSRRDIRAFEQATLERHDVRLLAIDRAGYGETDPAGLDRRDVAADLLTIADHFGVAELPVLAVSMGGIYAVTAAAIAPERITRVVLISAHALPYDDPAVESRLSESERADLDLLRHAPRAAVEREVREAVAQTILDPEGLLRGLASTWHGLEHGLLETPWLAAVAQSVAFGLSTGHTGYLEDGLRTVRPLEFDLADVRCPVRAIHGTIDDLEPYANLERLAARLPDCAILALPGMGHFGPWVWPELVFALLAGA